MGLAVILVPVAAGVDGMDAVLDSAKIARGKVAQGVVSLDPPS